MQVTPGTTLKKTLLQRQIPTIVGLIVLVLGMIGGIWFLYQGPAVFAPRATPQTTPKNIKVTNVTDASFTVSFVTDEATAGFVKYGAAANALNTQAGDDRDQLSGSVGKFTTHHVTVRGLTPNTQYFYTLGTGSNARFDNNGAPFTIKTTPRGTTPPAAKTIYGPVLNESGSPAEGAIVYVSLTGVGEMSSLVKSSGSWAVTLSNARTTDGTQYATIKDTDELAIMVQGPRVTSTASTTVTVAEAQPVPQISLGTNTSKQETSVKTVQSDFLSADQDATTQATAASDVVVATDSAVKETTQVRTQTKNTLTSALDETVASDEADENTDTTSADEDDGGSSATGGTSQQLALAVPSATPKASSSPSASPKASTSTLLAAASATPRATASPRASASPTATPRATASPTASPKASGTPFGSGNPYPATTSASPKATSTATTSSKGGSSTRSAVISSSSAVPVSGAVETTLALVLGGVFFVGSGIWSYWIARQLEEAPEYQ